MNCIVWELYLRKAVTKKKIVSEWAQTELGVQVPYKLNYDVGSFFFFFAFRSGHIPLGEFVLSGRLACLKRTY